MTATVSAPLRRDRRPAALTIGAVLLLVAPLIFAVTPASPVSYFDVDPRSEAARLGVTAIGPTAMAWAHVLMVLASAAAIGISAAAGGAIRWWWVALTGVGVAVALLHLEGPIEQWLQVGAWVSSACLGLAAAHLAQHELPRGWMVSALIALLVPLALSAGYYVLVEHPMTVEHYEATKAEMLASRGWAEGSTQALMYERRLTDPSVVGAYGLSNVFGSVVGGLTMLALGAAVFRLRRLKRSPRAGAWWVLATLVVFGFITLLLTQSKGVAAAACAGVVLLGLVLLVRPLRLPRWAPAAAAVALVLAAIAAVCVRGWIGAPETWEGERSLLFRWYYWQAAAGSLMHGSPLDWLVGVGPERFHVEYETYKNPLSPEIVTSTHNAFVDWVTMLGVGGLAWSALLIAWIAQPLPASEDAPPDSAADDEPKPIVAAVALAAAAFGVQYAVKVSQFWIDSVLVWLAGVVGFIAVLAVLVPLLRGPGRALVVGAFVAATLIVVHAQIEMTFFQYPSLPMVWLLVGLAGGSLARPLASSTSRGGLAAPAAVVVALIGVAAVLVAAYAAPMTATQGRLADAALALQRGQAAQAVDALDAAGRLAPADPRLLRWRVQLRQEWAAEAWRAGRADVAERVLASGLALLNDPREQRVLGAAPLRHRSNLHLMMAERSADGTHLQRAAEARAAALELSPFDLSDQLNLAELYERLDRPADAARAYERALGLNDQKYLDPAEQLTAAQRAGIEAKVAGLR